MLQHIRRLYELGARHFKVIDRTFNLDIERARQTLQLFLELFSDGNPNNAYVQFEVVPD
ncbi:MAG: B12-binding domain-containing radical SAM protein, partial [Spirochaetaceae bacterium]